jgi:hypothetical protein
MIRPSGYGRSARIVDFTEYLSPTSNIVKVPSVTTKTLQKFQATTISGGNTLDKSAPGALHKGKTRIEPRKPTKTKKVCDDNIVRLICDDGVFFADNYRRTGEKSDCN